MFVGLQVKVDLVPEGTGTISPSEFLPENLQDGALLRVFVETTDRRLEDGSQVLRGGRRGLEEEEEEHFQASSLISP